MHHEIEKPDLYMTAHVTSNRRVMDGCLRMYYRYKAFNSHIHDYFLVDLLDTRIKIYQTNRQVDCNM